jgi:class 3 adenylate cyclase
MAIVPERKLVTVLFCDLVGSTRLGEQLDAEALHSLKTAYFARVQSMIDAYHGVVEKFIGDAVVAIFGVPAVHEDDAERALLCALDITHASAELNTTLRPKFGIGISVRIGVNTGEVMIDSTTGGDVIASGDVMNTAARLQQAADPGEVLAGRDTMLLTRSSVEYAGPKRIRVKGKAHPVEAWTARGKHSAEKRVTSRLVGRGQELQTLAAAVDSPCKVVAHRSYSSSGSRASERPDSPMSWRSCKQDASPSTEALASPTEREPLGLPCVRL